jgi:hypothetical protein
MRKLPYPCSTTGPADGKICWQTGRRGGHMGRSRVRTVSDDEALGALVIWIHARLNEARVTYTQLARDMAYDRSWVSRSLSGRRLPPWPLVSAAAAACGASLSEARELWHAAVDDRCERDAQAAQGYPPAGLGTYRALCDALGQLVATRVPSQRELVRRDASGQLTRSTIGAVLRRERSLSRDVMHSAVTACGLDRPAVDAWLAAWDQYGKPFREAMEQRRQAIACARLSPWWCPRHGSGRR